jgi:glycosyltransferase involved in cell wall biosynthesis
MKVLHVIHGYPPYYMAGSEVYTYNLTRELAKHDDIIVFTRIENPFEKAYSIHDENIDDIKIRRINKPQRDYTLKDKYLDKNIDIAFESFAKTIQPDIVHIGHLSHLSTNMVKIAKKESIPVIYTVHDFWLFCFRGQMIDSGLNLCSGPSDKNCLRCVKYLFKDKITEEDVTEYREHMKHVVDNIDVFLSPSLFLKKFYVNNGVSPKKIRYSKYGFNKNLIKFKDNSFEKKSTINFGYMGRIIPVKGVKILLEAFQDLKTKNANLYVFGDSNISSKYLGSYANKNVLFKGSFPNWEINRVLDQIDVLIVPSLWFENSPLVIQEAFLAGIPVITSDIGGMAELVKDRDNGFTFPVGDKIALMNILKGIIEDPTILNELKPSNNIVRSIQDDAMAIHSLYEEVVNG